MQLSITDLNNGVAGHLDTVVETGEPAYIVNTKTKTDRGVMVSAELWDEILRVPSVRKRISEHAATKRAERENSEDDVA